MRIPVFVSCPTDLSKPQDESRSLILAQLDRFNLELRALGRSDYPTELPLREVLILAKRCSGGIILGFEQIRVAEGVSKLGTPHETPIHPPVSIPSPWNHLESGILFSLGLPLLVFRDEAVSGGVFDPGVTDVFVHNIPRVGQAGADPESLSEVFLRWQGRVREHYYR